MDKNTKKVKIGIIHTSMDVIGGAEKTTLCLLDALKKTNYDVTIYTTTKKLPISNDFKIVLVKKKSFPLFWRFQRLLENMKLLKLAKNEDLIIIMGGGLLIGKFKTKTLLYCHSTFNAELNFLKSKENKFLYKIYNQFLKRKISKQFEHLKKSNNVNLISNSKYTASQIKQNFSLKSVIINPPVNLSEFNLSLKNKRDGVITISRYSLEKNLEFAISTMKNIPIKYRLIGNARFTAQKKIYEHFMKICKNNENMELLCNIKRELILNHLQSSKIYFHTSEETFGISVVESIAAGCIPIVPDNSANKETVPFQKLRYKTNNIEDAQKLILKAFNGEFDDYIPLLKEHITKFDSNIFQEKMINYIENQM